MTSISLAAFDLFKNPVLDLVIPIAFGGTVLGVAIAMYRMEVRREPSIDKAENDAEAKHLRGMVRRRKQVAFLIGILGCMLMLCNSWIPWTRIPNLTAIYLLSLLILVVWILLLTVGDFTANRVYLAVRLGQVHQRQREMEAIYTHKQSHPPAPLAPSVVEKAPPAGDGTISRMRDADQSGHDPELN